MTAAPSTKIRPGRSVAFSIAFGVDNPKDVTVEASWDWDYAETIWTTDL